jgi:WD40 repeat protein
MYRKEYDLDSEEGERRSRNFKANLIIFKRMKDKNPELPFDSSMDSPAEEFLAFLKPYAEFPSMDLQFTGASQQTLIGHSGGIHCLVVVDSLTGTFASGSFDKTIKLWRKNSSGQYQCIQTLVGHDHYVIGLVSLTDGSFASGSYDNTIKIWKTDSTGQYKCIQSIQTNFRSLRAITSLSNGTIVCGEQGGPYVRFYAKDTSGVYQLVGTLDTTFTYGTRSILELADGSIAISSLTDGDIIYGKKTVVDSM